MKTTIYILIILTLLSFRTSNNKSLLIGNWRQFAYKGHDSAVRKKIQGDCSSKTISFREDGTYEEEMYCLTSSGRWYFNSDQTKFGFSLDSFNGTKIQAFSDTTKWTNIIILKLTADTLIYGHEAYYGNEKKYGHDDWYFVRQ